MTLADLFYEFMDWFYMICDFINGNKILMIMLVLSLISGCAPLFEHLTDNLE